MLPHLTFADPSPKMYAYRANMLFCARNNGEMILMAEMAEDGSMKWYIVSHSHEKNE
jgi:hypothetical protein